jgi:arginase family enzyme
LWSLTADWIGGKEGFKMWELINETSDAKDWRKILAPTNTAGQSEVHLVVSILDGKTAYLTIDKQVFDGYANRSTGQSVAIPLTVDEALRIVASLRPIQ